MAIPRHIKRDLRRLLRRFGANAGTASVPKPLGHALEAWLMMRLAHSAHRSGDWFVSLRDGHGNRLAPRTRFAFPTSQAGIAPNGPSTPGRVLLVARGAPHVRLELHGNLQWLGRSGTSHELDVSVLPCTIADPLRAAGGGHPHGLPIAAYECKDRDTTASTDEMRQTLARLYDLALVTTPYPDWGCRMFEPTVPTRWGRWRSTYRAFYAAGALGVVRDGNFGLGARTLGAHYAIGLHGSVYGRPSVIDAVASRFLAVVGDPHRI